MSLGDLPFDFVCEECKNQCNKYLFNLKEDGEYSRKCKICSGCKFLKCNRCPWNDLTVEQFDKHKGTGAYLKTCRKCMIYSKAYSKQKYQDNREEIREEAKERYQEIKEKKIEQTKKWQEDNKDKLLEVIRCDCGVEIQYRNKHKHFKTKKHLKYLETLKIRANSRNCLYCGDMFCDDVVNPKTNKIYETCEKHRGCVTEAGRALKLERHRIENERNKKLFEHFKNKPITNVLHSVIVDTIYKLLEWFDDDTVVVRYTTIIDEDHVEVFYANKEDEIEAELYINKDRYEMKWGRLTL